MRHAVRVMLLVMLGAFGAVRAELLEFRPDEIADILRHGPWPMPPQLDAGNPVSGRAAAIELGRRLFSDARLSAGGRLSCASCHLSELAFADGRPRAPDATGLARLDRNAPSLLNAAQHRWQGWDGASDSLWSQALRVMLEPREFDATAAHADRLVRSDRTLARRWREIFGRLGSPERTQVQMAQAIGAYVATLESPRTAFDEFRDALLRGDPAAASRYPIDAQRGLRLFIGRGRCNLCHLGPLFSSGEFADVGVPFFVAPGVVDPGRHRGIQTLQASPYNLLGRWARPRVGEATATRHLRREHRHFGEFKVPSLRGVAATAPYMHDGSLATLADVVRHYDRIDLERLHADGERLLAPLYLSDGERADLEAFLRTLGPGLAGEEPRSLGVITSRHVASREVWVWLPPGYEREPARRYPVLYLQDAQNLFERSAFGSGWQLGRTAWAMMARGEIAPGIVVAIANTADRIDDYTPWPMSRDGRPQGGNAAAYARFVVDELKPLIDARVRTRPGREHSAVGGSSLGGLVSMWLLMRESASFSAALVVSPSVWWADEAIVGEVERWVPGAGRPRLWLDTGLDEGDEAVRAARRLAAALRARGFAEGRDFAVREEPGARHHEAAWAARLPEMLRFLWPAGASAGASAGAPAIASAAAPAAAPVPSRRAAALPARQ